MGEPNRPLATVSENDPACGSADAGPRPRGGAVIYWVIGTKRLSPGVWRYEGTAGEEGSGHLTIEGTAWTRRGARRKARRAILRRFWRAS